GSLRCGSCCPVHASPMNAISSGYLRGLSAGASLRGSGEKTKMSIVPFPKTAAAPSKAWGACSQSGAAVHVIETSAGAWLVRDELDRKGGHFRNRVAAFKFIRQEFGPDARTLVKPHMPRLAETPAENVDQRGYLPAPDKRPAKCGAD